MAPARRAPRSLTLLHHVLAKGQRMCESDASGDIGTLTRSCLGLGCLGQESRWFSYLDGSGISQVTLGFTPA